MSMVKLIYSDAFDKAADVSMRILEDPDTITKQASTIFGCDYSDLKPDKDHVGIHLIALGDMEHFGLNRNADGFPKEACEKYHDTFVKHGHVYRHHRNKDPRKALGNIKASAYNDDMGRIELFIHAHKEKARDELQRLEKDGEVPFSMAIKVPGDHCFMAGTLVTTDSGTKNIEDVKVGDVVLTHQGNWKPVTAVHRNMYSGDIVTLKVTGLPSIRGTASHPVFSVDSSVIHLANGRRVTLLPDSTIDKFSKTDIGSIEASIKQVDLAALRPGDGVVTPILNFGSSADFNPYFYVAGQYCGDGSLIKVRRGRKHKGEHYITGVEFACSNDDATVRKLESALKAITDVHVRVGYCQSRNYYRIRVTDRVLANKLRSEFGEYFDQKRIQISSFKTQGDVRSFIGGMIDSDGSVDYRKQSARICSSGEPLASGVQSLLQAAGILSTLSKRAVPPDTGFKNSRPYTWVVFLNKLATSSLRAYSSKLEGMVIDGRYAQSSQVWDNYILRVVESLEINRMDDVTVYNLSVADDETYIAGFISVHNCTVCNQFRTGPKDPNQCEHIAEKLGEILDDGVKVGMINRSGTWFDISFVGRPADRTAWSLKVASGAFVDSVKLAEAEGIWVPDSIAIESASALRKLELMRKMADYETRYLGWASDYPRTHLDRYNWELRKAASASLDDATIETLRAYEPRDVFAGLAKVGAVLDPESFFKYVFGVKYGELAEYVPGAIARVRTVFSDTVKSGECQKICNDGYFDVDISRFEKTAQVPMSVLVKCAADLAFVGPSVDERVIRNTIDQQNVKIAVDNITKNEFNTNITMVVLAEKYAAYKLSALEAILDTPGDTEKETVCAIAAAQNLIER